MWWDRSVWLEPKNHKDSITTLLKTHHKFLTSDGVELKEKIINMENFTVNYSCLQRKDSTMSRNSIFDKFIDFYKKTRQSILGICCPQSTSSCNQCHERAQQSSHWQKNHDFSMLLSTASPQAQRYATVNWFGPIRNLRRYYKNR